MITKPSKRTRLESEINISDEESSKKPALPKPPKILKLKPKFYQ